MWQAKPSEDESGPEIEAGEAAASSTCRPAGTCRATPPDEAAAGLDATGKRDLPWTSKCEGDDDMTRSRARRRSRVAGHRAAGMAIGLLVGLSPFARMAAEERRSPRVAVQHDEKLGRVDVTEGGAPVLRYNFGTVAVPERVKGKKYAEARSDYIHPLYGPDGELLTEDFPSDHPHHRGVYWAWPEVYYKGGKRDLHALQGVFARPAKLACAGGAPATLDARSVWMWNDDEPIVTERAILRVHKSRPDGGRWIDLEFRFTARVDGVAVARRNQTLYGGLNLRSTLHGKQKIEHHTDPAGAKPRRNWGQIVGVPKGGKSQVAIAILEHASNPDYPGEWIQYPYIAWLQPAFPRKGTKFALSRDRPLVLRYRLWVRRGAATRQQLAKAWEAYHKAVRKPTPAKAEKPR
jgi:hypothetical protein